MTSSQSPSTPDSVKRQSTGHAILFGGEGGPDDKPAAMPAQDAQANTTYIARAKAPTAKPLATGNRFHPGVDFDHGPILDASLFQRARCR